MPVGGARTAFPNPPARPGTAGMTSNPELPQAVVSAMSDEKDIAAIAGSLGATSVNGFSEDEAALLALDSQPRDRLVRAVSARIQSGQDPLGEAFCRIRTPIERQEVWAVYTPKAIIDGMLSWAETQEAPDRGCGLWFGQVLGGSGRRFPNALGGGGA